MALLAAVLAAGCAGGGAGADRPGDGAAGALSAPPDTALGHVRQVGSEPFVRTLIEGDEEQVQVMGPLEEELGRLVGARVRAHGESVEAETTGEGLRVVSYEILSVDGERPEVGLLRYGDDGYYLERQGAGDLPLQGVPPRLQGHLGAKIWVVTGSGGTVERYAIVRPVEGGEDPGAR